MLPVVMDHLIGEKPERWGRMADLARAAGVDTTGKSPEEAARAARDAVAGLIDTLGLPRRLRDVGADEADFDEVAAAAMGDLVVAFSPVTVNKDDVVSLLRQAY